MNLNIELFFDMETCIFDLDGVIVDTAKYHFLAWKKLAEELGITITEKDNERLKGVGRMESLNIILSIGGLQIDDDKKEELTEKKNSWFVDYIQMMKSDEIFNGVAELLSDLKANNVKIALASSSKNAKTVIAKLGIEDWFEVVVDGNMITHSKPHPEIFLTAAERLHVSPENCIVVEDAEAGVNAAKKAGMKCIGIGDPKRLYKADKVVDHIEKISLEELRKL